MCSKLYLVVVDAESQPLWLPLRPDSTPSRIDLPADVGRTGDGSRPAAAQRRLMVTPPSAFGRLDRSYAMILGGTFVHVHAMSLGAPPQGHMHRLPSLDVQPLLNSHRGVTNSLLFTPILLCISPPGRFS